MIPQDNLKARQKDYAVFLPALSSFYSFQICKYGKKIQASRIPAAMQNGIEGLNFLDADKSYFYYPWCLYSAGHAILEVRPEEKEEMVRNRDPSAFVLGDSGGFQIGKGVWEGDWKDPNCPKAHAKRDGVLRWMDAYMDYGMVLDIPAWVARSPAGARATGISTYAEAVKGTRVNNDYWMANRTGRCKFLNVLQGENHTEADDWYEQVKDYCDPKKYPGTHFNGWAMGGQNMCDIHLVLRRIVAMIRDGLLEEGIHDWMHFLGTSKLEWALLLTDIQRAVRKHHNPKFTISYDCASPFMANAKGLVYSETRMDHGEKWTYSMDAGLDDKKYARDTRLYGDVARLEGKDGLERFVDSHLSKHMMVKDICCYAPGDLNMIGKEGKTSWDSFSYAIQMGHNVWKHIDAVLTANELYDQGIMPDMLIRNKFHIEYFTNIVDDIIANASNSRADELIEHYNKFWMEIIGQRGYVGKKTVNASTMYNRHWEEIEDPDAATAIIEKNLKEEKPVPATPDPQFTTHIEFEGNLKKEEISKPKATKKTTPQFKNLFEAN